MIKKIYDQRKRSPKKLQNKLPDDIKEIDGDFYVKTDGKWVRLKMKKVDIKELFGDDYE